ncbi:hypothetical protein A3K72_00055 [Candidatus Woesearchaeota archaeon RBG_13_36_6]|nr:MAG: hypothetical protein A3K72_00055 [Candidatus Woesearchaeota archaeon RBG_13_36_6]
MGGIQMDDERKWQFLSEAHIGDVVRLEMREWKLYIGPKQREVYVLGLTPDRLIFGKEDPFVKYPFKYTGPISYRLSLLFSGIRLIPYESIEDYEVLEQTDERFFSEVNIGDVVKLEIKKRKFNLGARQRVGYVWELYPHHLRLRSNHPAESRPLSINLGPVYLYNYKGTIKLYIPYTAIEDYEVVQKCGLDSKLVVIPTTT